MDIGNRDLCRVKGKAVAHHEITPGILLLFIKVGKTYLAALAHFFKIRTKCFGADEKRPDIFLFKRFFALGKRHLFPQPLMLAGIHFFCERGGHGSGNQPYRIAQ